MQKIFTKRFFDLSAYDQAAIVDAVLRDVAAGEGRALSEHDRKRAGQIRQRIVKKAINYGILAAEEEGETE